MKYPPTKRLMEFEAVLARMIEANNGISPTNKELAAELGISGKAVASLIQQGIARGRLTALPHIQRTLQLVQDRTTA